MKNFLFIVGSTIFLACALASCTCEDEGFFIDPEVTPIPFVVTDSLVFSSNPTDNVTLLFACVFFNKFVDTNSFEEGVTFDTDFEFNSFAVEGSSLCFDVVPCNIELCRGTVELFSNLESGEGIKAFNGGQLLDGDRDGVDGENYTLEFFY